MQCPPFCTFWTADHRCIQCLVVDLTLDTPKISCRKCAKQRTLLSEALDQLLWQMAIAFRGGVWPDLEVALHALAPENMSAAAVNTFWSRTVCAG